MSSLRRIAAVVAGLFAVLAACVAVTPLPEELQRPHAEPSLRVLDADERLLREVRASDGARARFAGLAEFGDSSRKAMLAAEDQRFYSHPGVDPLAITRAALSNLRNLRVVSGASTLTMQLARTVRPHPRTLRGKLSEMILALRIEASLSKDRILEEYLNRVSFGPNLRGHAAASFAYFGKPPANLSLAEAAFLAALPQRPSVFAQPSQRATAEKRRNSIIDRLVVLGDIDTETAARARTEPLLPSSQRPQFGAPHLIQGLLGGALRKDQPGLAHALEPTSAARTATIVTTLDSALQAHAETALAATLKSLRAKRASSGSVLVVDNESGDVVTYVGSPDFFDNDGLGQNDGVRALRQPGSTLKPFLYALALEKLGYTPATVLPDIESHFAVPGGGTFTPRNYDGKQRGPVRLREALGNSLNIPAVWTLSQLGVEPFYGLLHELGFQSLTEPPEHYGLALALGSGEVRLLDLAVAYSTLARGGVHKPLRMVRRVERTGSSAVELPAAAGQRILPASVASQITDILADPHARSAAFGARSALDFPFPVAAKTGTSKGFRDNWVVGYTRAVTVAVWVGNFDGSAMENTSGITGAGPLFHTVMAAAARRYSTERTASAALDADPRSGLHRVSICPLSGGLATDDCPHAIDEWVATSALLQRCDMHERVRIRRDDGLRAGPSCSPGELEERVFERFPAEYLQWASQTTRALAPRDFSPLCPGAASSLRGEGGVRILYPEDGARFAIDPERNATLQVLAVPLAVPEGTHEAALLVDGEVVETVRSPFVANWQLHPGAHVLTARTNQGEVSASLRVQVRGP